jgi:general secretion pathway protein F
VRSGRRFAKLPSIARHAAQFYEHRLSLNLDRLMARLARPAVSIVIGALIVSIMSALLSITELPL